MRLFFCWSSAKSAGWRWEERNRSFRCSLGRRGKRSRPQSRSLSVSSEHSSVSPSPSGDPCPRGEKSSISARLPISFRYHPKILIYLFVEICVGCRSPQLLGELSPDSLCSLVFPFLLFHFFVKLAKLDRSFFKQPLKQEFSNIFWFQCPPHIGGYTLTCRPSISWLT